MEGYDMMAQWGGRDIDGFRMDVIPILSREQCFLDGVLEEGRPCSNSLPYYVDGPRVHEFLRDMSPMS